MSKQIIVLAALVASVFSVSMAQGSEDRNAPGDEHRFLARLAGNWDVTVRFPAGPGRTIEGRSSMTATAVMDGRILRQEYSSTFGGKPLSVVRYIGFDRYAQKFTEIQFESTHTDVLQSAGVFSADRRAIVSHGRHVDTAAGQPVNVRSVTTFIDDNTFMIEMFYGEGTNSAKSVTLTHRRRT
jgi:hypothetical protein